MRDRFDVRLGVARPVEPSVSGLADPAPAKPVVVVEYRSRGVPAYLLPPLLIVIAALGIMSYQNATAPYPVRNLAPERVAQREARPAAPAPEPARVEAAPVLHVVETSAAAPAPPRPAPKPLTGPAGLFELDTTEGLQPVAVASGPAAKMPEPPLVAPASQP